MSKNEKSCHIAAFIVAVVLYIFGGQSWTVIILGIGYAVSLARTPEVPDRRGLKI